MPDIQEIFNQYLDRAEALLAEGKLKDAYTLCMKVLENDPENDRGLALRKKTQEMIENFNIHTIDDRIEALKPLWEQGAYDELVKQLTELYRYAPHYEKIEKALADAQAMYRGAYNSQKSKRTGAYETELEQLFSEKKYTELIEKMQKNAGEGARDADIRKLHTRFRARIIQSKIQEKKSLFESEKYEDIVNFLHQLLDIDKDSELLADLLRTYRQKLLDAQIDEKREFILRATENAKMLYQIGKYEKAMQVAEEVLHINPKDSTIKSLYEKSKSAFEKLVRDETEDQIKQSAETLKQDAAAQPGSVINL